MSIQPVVQNNTVQPAQSADKKQSATIMMLKYGIALPTAYEVFDAGDTFIKAKKAGTSFTEEHLNKFKKHGDKVMQEISTETKQSMSKMIFKFAKPLLIVAAIGAGVGLIMKKAIDKYPDNKFLKAIECAASLFGF